MYKLVKGAILNPVSDRHCEFFAKGGLLLKKAGKKYQIKAYGKLVEVEKKIPRSAQVETLDHVKQFILPGLYDLHFHWVQEDVCLKNKANLLSWLSKYAWPAEHKFKQKAYSKKKASAFFKKLSAQGTVGGGCYSSLHGHALEHAMTHARGNFIIGNVLMTMNSPTYLSQTETNAKSLIKKFCQKYKERYAVTPRFAPTTSVEVMKFGSEQAKKHKCFIQTHLSETKAEIDYVKSIFSEFPGFDSRDTYTDIYRKSGVLGRRTIMGHGIYLGTSELRTLAKTKTAIAVCPTSNAPLEEGGLGSGICRVDKLNRYGVPWALGSDIGAGPYLSMFDVMDSFVKQHKLRGTPGIDAIMALYRSTLASAQILGVGKTHGNFKAGKAADFLVLQDLGISKSVSARTQLNSILGSCPKRKDYAHIVDKTFLAGVEL